MGDGRCKFEFHRLVGKKPYSPTSVAFRSFRTGKGRQTRLKLTIKNNSARRNFPFLTLQSRLKPVLDKSFFYVLYSSGSHPQRLGNIGNCPCWAMCPIITKQ